MHTNVHAVTDAPTHVDHLQRGLPPLGEPPNTYGAVRKYFDSDPYPTYAAPFTRRGARVHKQVDAGCTARHLCPFVQQTDRPI